MGMWCAASRSVLSSSFRREPKDRASQKPRVRVFDAFTTFDSAVSTMARDTHGSHCHHNNDESRRRADTSFVPVMLPSAV